MLSIFKTWYGNKLYYFIFSKLSLLYNENISKPLESNYILE